MSLKRMSGKKSRLGRRRKARRGLNFWAAGFLGLVAVVSTYCAAPQGVETTAEFGGRAGAERSYAYQSLEGTEKLDASAEKTTTVDQSETSTLRLRPANHNAAWIERHQAVARSNSNDCASCHQEEDCMACHTAELARPFEVHAPNFVTIHAADARLSPKNCTDCHQTQTFCTPCHMRTGVSAIESFEPPVRARFHPAGWLDARTPNNHGVMARRRITDCASCHQEQDCVSCHAGVNPHPPEFRLNCRTWIQANPAPCAKCHGDLGQLKAMCL